MGNISSKIIGRWLLNHVKLLWTWLRSVFSTTRTTKASPPDVGSDQNTNTTTRSESQEALLHPNRSFTDGSPVSEVIPDSLSDLPSNSIIARSQAGPVDEGSPSHPSDDPDISPEYEHEPDIVFPKVIISAFTETGQTESSIKVPKQRSYTGRKPVISSSLADTPCATLGVQGLLCQLNNILGTSRTLDTPSISLLLENCVSENYDFGTAYGLLRQVWNTDDPGTIQDELCRCEKENRENRRNALVGNRIVNPSLPPRCVWDLYSNRVVPWWIAGTWPKPISHAWMDEMDRVNVWTPINGKEWPVPIPKDTSLDLIRIEMLNLGLEYTWLDVLCLRQKGGPREDLRAEEWKLDVPTIRQVYAGEVVVYLSGLGRPFTSKEGDLESDTSWFRRAWTLQEVGYKRIIAGSMHAHPIDGDGYYVTELLTRFHNQLRSYLHCVHDVPGTQRHVEITQTTQTMGEALLGGREFSEVIIEPVETDLPVSSIAVPLQRGYRDRKPVLQSSLADTLCVNLGVDAVLSRLNTILGTSYDMNQSLSELLQYWIGKHYDFGTAYGYLRPRWDATKLKTINEDLHILGEEDRKMRKDAVTDERTVKAQTPPRRVWDLYSNRVVPQWVIPGNSVLWAISHAWMEDPKSVWTRINGYEWSVPIPADACLDRLRIELLNLGAEYVWVDVLCLRQKDGKGEAQRQQEWPLDVPTIGYVYRWASTVVYYFSGLGMALSDTAGDVENNRCWFKRAWTLQEISRHRIYAGITDDYLLYAQAAGGKDVGGFQKELASLKKLALENNSVFKWCRHMQNRDAVHPTDRVVGLAFPLRSLVIPAYNVNRSDEDTWTILVESMAEDLRGEIFFLCPEGRANNKMLPGDGTNPPKWAPSWEQIMIMTLRSTDDISLRELVTRSDKKGIKETDDFHDGICIERADVQGLAIRGTELTTADRSGRMIVNDRTGKSGKNQVAFNVVAMHQHPIPEGSYTLIGSRTMEYWVVGRRLPNRRFEKVSVFRMPDQGERKQLKELGVHTNSRNYLT